MNILLNGGYDPPRLRYATLADPPLRLRRKEGEEHENNFFAPLCAERREGQTGGASSG